MLKRRASAQTARARRFKLVQGTKKRGRAQPASTSTSLSPASSCAVAGLDSLEMQAPVPPIRPDGHVELEHAVSANASNTPHNAARQSSDGSFRARAPGLALAWALASVRKPRPAPPNNRAD